MPPTILNKDLSIKDLTSLTRQGYAEYQRYTGGQDFDKLLPAIQDAWVSAIDRVVELVLLTKQRED